MERWRYTGNLAIMHAKQGLIILKNSRAKLSYEEKKAVIATVY